MLCFCLLVRLLPFQIGERYDFVISADQPVGAYWVQVRGLGECGIRRVQQLAILRYARGPYQPTSVAPTYDVGLPQGVVSSSITDFILILDFFLPFLSLSLFLFIYSFCISHFHSKRISESHKRNSKYREKICNFPRR